VGVYSSPPVFSVSTLSFSLFFCHSRFSFVIPAFLLSFPRRRESIPSVIASETTRQSRLTSLRNCEFTVSLSYSLYTILSFLYFFFCFTRYYLLFFYFVFFLNSIIYTQCYILIYNHCFYIFYTTFKNPSFFEKYFKNILMALKFIFLASLFFDINHHLS